MSKPEKEAKPTVSPAPVVPPPAPTVVPVVRFGPDHRDIYLLIIGILVGVLAGPGVLGKLSPRLYDWLIFDGTQARYESLQKTGAEDLNKIVDTGASVAAVKEYLDKRSKENETIIQAYTAARNEYTGRMSAILLAIAALMVLEAMIDPASTTGLGRRRGQLATARYALLALWLAMILAEPSSLRYVADNLLFVVLLIALGLTFALVPLGWLKSQKPKPNTPAT